MSSHEIYKNELNILEEDHSPADVINCYKYNSPYLNVGIFANIYHRVVIYLSQLKGKVR